MVNNDKSIRNSLIGVIYRHPQNSISEFIDKFSEHLLKIISENKNIYITGDFNIDFNKVDSNVHINNYANMLSSFNLHNTFNLSTRISNTTQTLLDHFYSNNSSGEINTSVLLSDLSDHFPLLTTIKHVKPKLVNKIEYYYHRNYRSINTDNILSETTIMINNIMDNFTNNTKLNIHEKFTILTDGLKNVMNKHIPLKKLSRKEQRLKQKPWITIGILNSKTRNKLHKKLSKTNFLDIDLKNKFKKYSNKLTHIKIQSKNRYYQNRFNDCKNDSSKTWNIINDIVKNKSKFYTISTKLEIDSCTLTDPQQILNSLNSHFSTIGKIQRQQNLCNNNLTSSLSNQLNSIVFQSTTTNEIESIISKLDSKKASGADEISVSFLKIIKSLVSPIISRLINDSYSSGVYPDSLKISKVIPIHKGGKKSIPGNYRPISLLSNINKIIEKTIYSRLVSYFNKYNIISEHQFRFRQGHNTTMAVTEFYGNLN